MAKGESLKKYKSEQKDETRNILIKIINDLKASNQNVSVSSVASIAKLSRANIYAHYSDLFNEVAPIDAKITNQDKQQDFKTKNQIIEKLQNENKELKQINSQLIDQIIALKLIISKKI